MEKTSLAKCDHSDLLEIVAYAIQTNPLDKSGSRSKCNLELAMQHRVAEIEKYLEDGEKQAKKYWYKNMMRVPLSKPAETEDGIRWKRAIDESLKRSEIKRWRPEEQIYESSSTASANSIANEFNVDRQDPVMARLQRVRDGGGTSSESDTLVQRPFAPYQFNTPSSASMMDVAELEQYYGEGLLRVD